MNRKAQLHLLARVRKQRKQLLASDMAKARMVIQQQEEHLEGMLKWKTDYKERAPGSDSLSQLTASSLNQWRQFLAGLDVAIERQRNIIRSSENQLTLIIEQWREAEKESLVSEQLLEDLDAETRLIEEHAEQDVADDIVNSNHFRSMASVSA